MILRRGERGSFQIYKLRGRRAHPLVFDSRPMLDIAHSSQITNAGMWSFTPDHLVLCLVKSPSEPRPSP